MSWQARSELRPCLARAFSAMPIGSRALSSHHALCEFAWRRPKRQPYRDLRPDIGAFCLAVAGCFYSSRLVGSRHTGGGYDAFARRRSAATRMTRTWQSNGIGSGCRSKHVCVHAAKGESRGEACLEQPADPSIVDRIPLLDLDALEHSEIRTATPFLDSCRDLGVFQVVVPKSLAAQSADAFALSSTFLGLPEADKERFKVRMSETSGPPNGYQAQGKLGGRYNRYRSGFVFQGDTLWPLLNAETELLDGQQVNQTLLSGTGSSDVFVDCLAQWRANVWQFAERIFERLYCELRIKGIIVDGEDAADTGPMQSCFGRHGTRDMITHSQFHIKKMHPAPLRKGEVAAVRMPLHQDPSFMSIVVHAFEEPAGQGLEVLDEVAGEFVPVTRSGCSVATVLVGQLFHALIPSRVPDTAVAGSEFRRLRPARAAHRVVTRDIDMEKDRLAATFFFQPGPDDDLAPLSSVGVGVDSNGGVGDSYGERRRRAYARYFRAEGSD